MKRCLKCYGRGRRRDPVTQWMVECQYCSGTGKVQSSDWDPIRIKLDSGSVVTIGGNVTVTDQELKRKINAQIVKLMKAKGIPHNEACSRVDCCKDCYEDKSYSKCEACLKKQAESKETSEKLLKDMFDALIQTALFIWADEEKQIHCCWCNTIKNRMNMSEDEHAQHCQEAKNVMKRYRQRM